VIHENVGARRRDDGQSTDVGLCRGQELFDGSPRGRGHVRGSFLQIERCELGRITVLVQVRGGAGERFEEGEVLLDGVPRAERGIGNLPVAALRRRFAVLVVLFRQLVVGLGGRRPVGGRRRDRRLLRMDERRGQQEKSWNEKPKVEGRATAWHERLPGVVGRARPAGDDYTAMAQGRQEKPAATSEAPRSWGRLEACACSCFPA